MKHLSEDELIEHYYGEGGTRTAKQHLAGCAECEARFQELTHELEEIERIEVPERGAEYGAAVWAAIRNSAEVYEAKAPLTERMARWTVWMRYAGACAVLIVVGFVGGRLWEQRHAPQPLPKNAPVATATGAQELAQTQPDAAETGQEAESNKVAEARNTTAPKVRERVVLLVMGDHLERSERLLVALRHADEQSSGDMRKQAEELLAPNRLYRSTAERSGDVQLSSALERLERVLMELANSPEGGDEAALKQVQEEMNHEGVLFEIRVLRTRAAQSMSKRAERKGAQI